MMLEQLDRLLGDKFWDCIKGAIKVEIQAAMESEDYSRMSDLSNLMSVVTKQPVSLSTDSSSASVQFSSARECLQHYGCDYNATVDKLADRTLRIPSNFTPYDIGNNVVLAATDIPTLQLAVTSNALIGSSRAKIVYSLSRLILDRLRDAGKVERVSEGLYRAI